MASDTRLTLGTVGLVAALTGATGFALGRFTSEAPTARVDRQPEPSTRTVPDDLANRTKPPIPNTMPPGHPPVDPNTSPPPLPAKDDDAPRALAWTKPAAWADVPNTSSMRIATYKAPIAAGDKAAPELTVIQAGGALEDNIQRWAAQFGDEGKASLKRESKKIAGYNVVIVTTHGPYGGMGGEAKSPEPFELLAAIVETPDLPYFFKMTGPMKSVEAARKDFDVLLASFKKP